MIYHQMHLQTARCSRHAGPGGVCLRSKSLHKRGPSGQREFPAVPKARFGYGGVSCGAWRIPTLTLWPPTEPTACNGLSVDAVQEKSSCAHSPAKQFANRRRMSVQYLTHGVVQFRQTVWCCDQPKDPLTVRTLKRTGIHRIRQLHLRFE